MQQASEGKLQQNLQKLQQDFEGNNATSF